MDPLDSNQPTKVWNVPFFLDLSEENRDNKCQTKSLIYDGGPVRLSVRMFQLASQSLRDVVAKRRYDYCPLRAILNFR